MRRKEGDGGKGGGGKEEEEEKDREESKQAGDPDECEIERRCAGLRHVGMPERCRCA